MTEQQITMLALRYLAQVCDAIGEGLQAGHAENEVSAWHCIHGCLADIHKIALNSSELQDQKHRLFYIRDAMVKLKIARERQSALAGSRVSVPAANEIDVLRVACTGAVR